MYDCTYNVVVSMSERYYPGVTQGRRVDSYLAKRDRPGYLDKLLRRMNGKSIQRFVRQSSADSYKGNFYKGLALGLTAIALVTAAGACMEHPDDLGGHQPNKSYDASHAFVFDGKEDSKVQTRLSDELFNFSKIFKSGWKGGYNDENIDD
jgi:hypothetical protein